MVVEGSVFSHSDLISLTRYYPINTPITYKGHDPEAVYKVPHFDFHFYLISPSERERITARGDDLLKCGKPLPAEFVPEGYVPAPGSEEPGMGYHWVEPGSHEFHGKAFTHTF